MGFAVLEGVDLSPWLTPSRLVSARVAHSFDAVGAEVVLGGEVVVHAASERQIFRRLLAAVRKGVQVVELEPMRLSATLP